MGGASLGDDRLELVRGLLGEGAAELGEVDAGREAADDIADALAVPLGSLQSLVGVLGEEDGLGSHGFVRVIGLGTGMVWGFRTHQSSALSNPRNVVRSW